MKEIHLFLWFILVLSNFSNSFSESSKLSEESRLHKYLFEKEENSTGNVYNPKLRPVKKSKQVLNVQANLGVKRLFEMDEVNHRVTVFAVLICDWKDEFLNWDPAEFGNITYTYVDYWKIWTPQVTLVSKYINEKSSPSDNSIHKVYENYPVKLYNTGKVEFVPSLHLSSECLFNYGRFPFEIQICLFYFQLPYTDKQVELKLNSYLTSEYSKYDMIWSINDIKIISINEDKNKPVNVVQFSFMRKYKNYLLTIPSYVVYILTLLMFLLPQQSNQRIIIGSTCLVIMSMMSAMMSASLPQSDLAAWPLLGKLYLFNIVMITFSILFSTFIINVSQTDHQKSVPDWLKKLTLSFLSKIFCIQAVAYSVFSSYTFKVHDDENVAVQEHISSQLVMQPIDDNVTIRNRESNSNSSPTATAVTRNSQSDEPVKQSFTLTKLLKKTMIHLEQLRYKMQKETYKKCKNNEWLLVGVLADKIFFLIYCSIIIISTMTIFKS